MCEDTAIKVLQTLPDVSVIVAAIVAIWGITAWRREHVGKRRIDLAEEVLALFYEARDAISHIRCGTTWQGEGSTRKPLPNESAEEKEACDAAFVTIERYQQQLKLFSRLHSLRYRFIAQMGEEKGAPFEDLNKLVSKIRFNAHQKVTLEYLVRRAKMPETQANYSREIDKADDIVRQKDENDTWAQEVDQVVEKIEAICRPIVDRKWKRA